MEFLFFTQETIEELRLLTEGSAGCSSKLREENAAMAKKASELARHCEVSIAALVVLSCY